MPVGPYLNNTIIKIKHNIYFIFISLNQTYAYKIYSPYICSVVYNTPMAGCYEMFDANRGGAEEVISVS